MKNKISKTTSQNENELVSKPKKFSKFKTFMSNKLIPAFGKVGTQRHLLAIRNGIISALPFVLVGSLFTIINSFPIGNEAGHQYLSDIMPKDLTLMFDMLNRFTMGMLALYVSIGIGAELSRFYRLSSTQGASLGAFGYIIWIAVVSTSVSPLSADAIADLNLNPEQLEAVIKLNDAVSLFGGGIWLNIKNLGGSSVFVAMISSTATIEMYRMCVKYNLTIRMPKQVPKAVSDSFLVLVPIFFMALIIGVMHFLIGFDLMNFLIDALKPMGSFIVNNLGGVVIITFLITFLWWFGIHGSSLVQSITRPFWLIALDENAEALKNGEPIPNMFVEPYFQWFAQYGGSGNTLALALLGAIFAKSKQVKTISRVALVPGIFNVNEPLTFGMPVILNPFMWVPFVFNPVITGICGYFLQTWLKFDWVAMAPWTLPFPVGSFLAAGAAWQAIVATSIAFIPSALLWAPFFVIYDKYTLKQETQAEIENEKKNKTKPNAKVLAQ